MHHHSFVILLGVFFTFQHARISEAQGNVRAILPKNTGPVAFGDPVFLPLAFVNATDEVEQCPDLTNLNARLEFRVSCGQHADVISLDSGTVGESTLRLPPRSCSVTVIMLNIWTPGFAREFIRTKIATIETRIPQLRAEATSRKSFVTKLSLSGNAFTTDPAALMLGIDDAEVNREWLFDSGGDVPRTGFTVMSPVTPLWNATTPLSWRTSSSNSESWYNEESRVVRISYDSVRPGTSVRRFIDFSLANDALPRNASRESVVGTLEHIVKILADVGTLERQWFIGATLNALSLCNFQSEEDQHAFRSQLLHAFPASAAQCLGKPSYTVVSFLAASEP